MSLVLSSAYFTGLCIISLYFVNALSLPTFNAFFPSSVSKVCLFCAGYVTLDTWPSVTLWKPPWSQENHASYLIPHLVLFWSSEHTKCKQKQPQSSERHAYFHRIPSVLVQEQENCFDLQTGFPVFRWLTLLRIHRNFTRKAPSLPALFPPSCFLQHLAPNHFFPPSQVHMWPLQSHATYYSTNLQAPVCSSLSR